MKSNYKKKLTLSLLIGFLLSSFFSERMEAKIELIDRVIAVVDSGVIMESELNQRVQDIIGRLRSEGTELPPKELLEEQV
ncbi:MAG TPA: molecular chaperone SurA, partial [Gammaproteobacteria bacterium]|nr:molecular chaperone SurA [Gammaproteobacteria bacterium]